MRSRAYVRLLVVAAVLGVPISALAWAYLALVSKLQHWLFTTLPSDLGFGSVPGWWPFPVLAAGGILVALSITYLPGTGGHSPADGLKTGGLFPPNELLGVLLASVATLAFGAVLGPEAPLIALGGGLGALIISRAKAAAAAPQVKVIAGAAGSFAAISTHRGRRRRVAVARTRPAAGPGGGHGHGRHDRCRAPPAADIGAPELPGPGL